ncbi:hypothetical protein HOY82DRAFT_607429 [Tuber indicum]|nr:hypothetical protein HOY82DRAFT_607429 [Tuber indicum]
MTFNTSDDDEPNSGTTNNDHLANGIAVDGWGKWSMDCGRLQLTVGGMGGGTAAGGETASDGTASVRSIDKQRNASPNCYINYHTYPLPSPTIHTGFPAPDSFQLLTKTGDMKAKFLKELTASRAGTPSSSSRSYPYGSRSSTSTPLAQPPALGDVGAPPPSRPQSTVPTNPGLYDLRRFYENTRRSLELDPTTHPLLDDKDLDPLSPGEHVLISLVCTALNSLQPVNERLARLESAGPTNRPQSLAGLESKLKDLTGIVTAHSSARQAAAPTPVRAFTSQPLARQLAPMTRKLETRPAQQPAADPDFPHLDRSSNTW